MNQQNESFLVQSIYPVTNWCWMYVYFNYRKQYENSIFPIVNSLTPKVDLTKYRQVE